MVVMRVILKIILLENTQKYKVNCKLRDGQHNTPFIHWFACPTKYHSKQKIRSANLSLCFLKFRLLIYKFKKIIINIS